MDDEEEVKVERGPPARYMLVSRQADIVISFTNSLANVHPLARSFAPLTHSLDRTVGEMAYTLLTSPKWLGSMLPRIPVPVAKSMDPSLQPYRTKYSGASAAMEGPKTSGFGGRPDTRFPPGTKAAGSGLGENRGDRKESRGGSRDRDRDRDRGGRYDDRDYRDRESGRRYDDRGGRDIYSRGRSRDRYNDRDRYGGDRGRDYDRREQDKDRYYSSGGTGGFGKYYNMTDEDIGELCLGSFGGGLSWFLLTHNVCLIAYERRQRERESERDRERPRSRDGRDKGRESVRERSRSPDRKHQRTDSRDR